ncbi:MAG: hypothetical protein ACI82Z_001436 [Cellvibrionaceae bacterium]|jgi:hypothetical protein
MAARFCLTESLVRDSVRRVATHSDTERSLILDVFCQKMNLHALEILFAIITVSYS